MSADINYVFAKGGFHTPTDEMSVEETLRTAEFTTNAPSAVAMLGFRMGVVNFRSLSIDELASLCESCGKKLTIQIE